MTKWSDGIERPDWYDGTALTREIENYFATARDAETERLRRENAEMRAKLFPAAKVAAA